MADGYEEVGAAAEASGPRRARRSPRRLHDAYPTVADLAAAIVGRVATYFPDVKRIVEPTAGDGAFVLAARQAWPDAKIVAVDLVADHEGECLARGASKFVCADAATIDYRGADLVLGNLPFNIAARILRRIHETNRGVASAFLLPVGFGGRTQGIVKGTRDETLSRGAEFWLAVKHRYHAYLHPRPSFTNDGRTDRMEYAVFGFGQGWLDAIGHSKLDDPIVWRPE